MSISLNYSMQTNEHHHERSRLDNVLPQNQELINNLNLKIDRRINNGYYYQVAAKRKTLPPANRYKFQPKLKPKKVHPVIKKPKKITEKANAVDQQQNTDEVDFSEKWQNTSGEYVLKEPDPIVEDESMQFSCQVTQILQKNQSMQWSIEPIQHFNQEVQYTLESQIVFVQCRDASIQYSFEADSEPEPEHQPEALPQPQPQIKVVYENAEIQCQKIKNQQISVQYNEPLPQTRQKDLQANLPDLKQLNMISSMENRMKYLKHEQRKQLKLQKKKDREIQILKLKQIMEKLQGKIELASQKQEYLKKRIESQLLLKEKQRKFKLQKQMVRKQAEKQYNSKLELLLSKLKQGYKRPQINNSFKEEEQRRLAQLQKEQNLSKEQLQKYRKQVDQLKKNLKNEMFKRLNYEDESDDDTTTQQGEQHRSSSQNISSFRRGSANDISMDSLFPNIKNRQAGSIVRNINSKQRKLNEHQEESKLSRAYWKSRSKFNYQYQQVSTVRINRKNNYLRNVEKCKLEKIEIEHNENPEQINHFSLLNSRTKNNMYQAADPRLNLRYKSKRLTFQWQQLKQIKKNVDDLLADKELFRYLYSQEDKIKLGLKLFQTMKIQISQTITKPIKIHKYLNYLVFEHKNDKNIQFIIFYQNRNVISGIIPIQITNSQFYQSLHKFKNGEVFQYFNQGQLFQGFYSNGQRQGYGILSNQSVYYEGDFSKGKKQGFGKLILENGDIYKGNFRNNHFDGEGVYKWTNGESFDGNFRQGLKHGWGRQNFKNGDIYEGQYKNNKRDGRGTYKWKDGTVYTGDFVNDQKCGEGKLQCTDGSSLIGEWRSDEIVQGTAKKAAKGRSRQDLPLVSKIKGQK